MRALDFSGFNFLPQNLVLQHWDQMKMDFRLYFQSQHIKVNLFQCVSVGEGNPTLYIYAQLFHIFVMIHCPLSCRYSSISPLFMAIVP